LEEIGALRATLIFFEAPQRLKETLDDMAAVLGKRDAAVAREVTKLHETVRRGELRELAQFYESNPPRGEVTVVVGPPASPEPDFRQADALLDRALPFMPLRPAVDLISEALKLPRKAVYARALLRKTVRADGI
jgi:16S rRNA (cytidine1402-2'-O)-methyltransferase